MKMRILCIALTCGLLANACLLAQQSGVNLPPERGNSNMGCFLAGIAGYEYGPDIFVRIKSTGQENKWPSGFSIRVPVNQAATKDEATLDRIHGYFQQTGGRGIVCWFETTSDPAKTHGFGRPPDIDAEAAGWKRIAAKFTDMPNVQYEIFNEPFGYKDATAYVRDMRAIITKAGLPASRCILDGLGWAQDVKAVSGAGWEGLLAYHFYPFWQEKGHLTVQDFEQRAYGDISAVSARVLITEFGGDLRDATDWTHENPAGAKGGSSANCFQGLGLALARLHAENKGIQGAYIWHGWDNGDSYDFWNPANKAGAAAEIAVMQTMR